MTFATYAGAHIHLTNKRISIEDGRRQESAAAEILGRLRRQPGVILADEVGMGKTFVAIGGGNLRALGTRRRWPGGGDVALQPQGEVAEGLERFYGDVPDGVAENSVSIRSRRFRSRLSQVAGRFARPPEAHHLPDPRRIQPHDW